MPQVYNFTEKMLRSKGSEYKLKDNKYKGISLYKKLMSGTAPITKYWLHSSMLKTALQNGWKVKRVYNTLAFTAQRICEDYIQFNQDMRLKYTSQGMEFLGLFHKLMNNGFYGWFCRAVESYQETQFSGVDSYNHFQVQNDEMCSGMMLQEQAVLVVQNPHDDDTQKREKIIALFDRQVKKANRLIESHEDFLLNCQSIVVSEHRSKKIELLRKYIEEITVGKFDALGNYGYEVQLKELEENNRRTECERNNKNYYQVPKSRQPLNTNCLKSRDEVINKALYGRQNRNTSIVIFDNDEMKSVCFGLITSQRQTVQMKSKNDVALSVLAHAKARISEFIRKLN